MTKLAISMLLVFAAGSAFSQQSLGDLLDRGGKRLTGAEVKALADTRVLRKAEDADAYMTLRADGTVVGIVHNKQGAGSSEAVGTWTVDADGRRCSSVQLPAFGMSMQNCGYVYRWGGSLWFAPSATDRTVSVVEAAGPTFQ